MSKRKRSPNVSNYDFIRANIELQDKTIEDIALRLGLSPKTVQQRRVKVNKLAGARILPALHRGKRAEDVDLMAIAEQVHRDLDVKIAHV